MLHLKRWILNEKTRLHVKNDTDVNFDPHFAVPDVGDYQLRGVIVHNGITGGGHYTAFVRSLQNDWYFYNDQATPLIQTVAQVLQSKPYMLVYER